MSAVTPAARAPSTSARRFEGKVAFITGAGAGIGRETARQLAAEGASVAYLTRTAKNSDATRDRLEALGVPVVAMVGDVAVPEDVERAISRTVDELGRLDIVVANAGITGDGGTIVD